MKKINRIGIVLIVLWLLFSFAMIAINSKNYSLFDYVITFGVAFFPAFVYTVIILIKASKKKTTKQSDNTNLANENLLTTNINVFTIEKMKTFINQIEESLNIMERTTNPETLFSRRKFGYERIKELQQLEKQCQFSLNTNSAILLDKYNKSMFSIIVNCYDRYTNKAIMELKTESAIKKRYDKFWEIASDYISNTNELRISVEKALHFPNSNP